VWRRRGFADLGSRAPALVKQIFTAQPFERQRIKRRALTLDDHWLVPLKPDCREVAELLFG
jgi:hypothetical protein